MLLLFRQRSSHCDGLCFIVDREEMIRLACCSDGHPALQIEDTVRLVGKIRKEPEVSVRTMAATDWEQHHDYAVELPRNLYPRSEEE